MNEFNISQISTIVNNITEQLTGQKAAAAITNTADFVAVAQTLLKTGVDPVLNAISQVWSRTLFAYRDYNAQNAALEMDLPRFGNAIRKLSPVAAAAVDDMRFKWPVAYDADETPPLGNGQSVDHYKISKQEVLQTNFYGSAVYQQRYTIFKDQLDVAFSSPDEFGRFLSMCMGERKNDRESYKEAIARGIQVNLIGAILAENKTERVVRLLTEYNAATGLELTATTVYQPDNFAPFMRWAYARIKTLARMMSQRSAMYQTNITGKTILRHTPADRLRVAIYAPFADQMEAMVLSDTYHDNYLKGTTFERVNYWQSISSPNSINVVPTYTSAAGAVTTGAAQTASNIFGVLHDVDALGYAFTNQWAATTPLNIDGGYWNEAHHATVKTIMDNTEKAVVLLLA